MDIHKNARLTPLGRERLVKMVLCGQTPQAAGEAAGVCPRTVRKWLERHKQRRLGGLAGSQLAAPSAAPADAAAGDRAYRSPAPSAHAGQGDRRPGRRLGRHREPCPEAPGPQQAERPGPGRADPPLPARAPWRAHPHRHQEARSLQHSRPPRQGRAPRGVAQSSGADGSSSMSASTTPRASPSARSSRTSESEAPSPSSRPPSPTTKASASPSSAS